VRDILNGRNNRGLPSTGGISNDANRLVEPNWAGHSQLSTHSNVLAIAILDCVSQRFVARGLSRNRHRIKTDRQDSYVQAEVSNTLHSLTSHRSLWAKTLECSTPLSTPQDSKPPQQRWLPKWLSQSLLQSCLPCCVRISARAWPSKFSYAALLAWYGVAFFKASGLMTDSAR
jgi:hypothetical protein